VLEKLLRTEGIDIVLRDMAQSWQKLRGGKFQLQYFADHLAEGTSIVKFEVREEIKVGEKTVARIYDIVTESDLGPINYELKNWSNWQSWSSKAFREQFLKDLAAMAEGKRIKWVFSGHKMSREEIKRKIIEALQDRGFLEAVKALIKEESQRLAIERILMVKDLRGVSLPEVIGRDQVFNAIFEIID
jgi:hypothetical protein